MTPKPTAPYRPRTLAPMQRVAGLDYGVLDELLGYALRRAQVAMFLAFHAATRGQDITPPRFTALVIVGANPGISQTALGNVLGIARSGAMVLTDWFQARGLIARRRAPDDRRAWGLHLTARGERMVRSMTRKVVALDRRRAAVLNGEERRQLLSLLNKLAA
ncbi:MAG: MarR family transcriptional regulator [Betaproteobacteria bacterium]|nr:MAG: MarR family transcriptional regulator [Betaproteobacteria bacterium]